ncbi:MAG: alpha/beta hydrolase [Candidatus Kapaibacterium sp.]|nr:MAG: alpha/beta hydrolase [Candidatus Kapabacteria bacterium]
MKFSRIRLARVIAALSVVCICGECCCISQKLFAQSPAQNQAPRTPERSTLSVTIATAQGVTGATIPVRNWVLATTANAQNESAQATARQRVNISPLYARTEAAAANAAFAQIPKENHLERAQAMFTLLRLTEYETITREFDTTVVKITPLQLAKQWRKREESLGAYKRIVATSAEQFATGDLVTVEAEFALMPFDVKFSFTDKHLLNGIAFSGATAKYRLPQYVRMDSIEERSVTIGAGSAYPLDGVLTLPKNRSTTATLPIAILLHGAGAEDKDRTSGPLKPSKDLALGLAMRGIASIRYDKRTKRYALQGAEATTFTVREEVIDDAVAALETARMLAAEALSGVNQSKTMIDDKNIVMIAPNLAATLLPRIYERDAEKNPRQPRIKSAVLLAPNAQSWMESLRTRFKRAFMLDGNMNADEQRVMATLEKEIKIATSDTLSSKTLPNTLPFNLPASFWLDLRSYNHTKALQNALFPMLILHGERDNYMSFEEEFPKWKSIFSAKKNVEWKSYPKLVNLLVPQPAEKETVERPANIPQEVVRDIADWIRKQDHLQQK